MNNYKKGSEFENKTFKIIKKLHPSTQVLQGVEIKGQVTKQSRNIDIQMVLDEYRFVAVECKDKSKPIDSPIVEGFVTRLKDFGTDKGAIISNSRYTQGAINTANEYNIDLFNLVNSDDPKIKTQIYIPSVFIRTGVKGMGYIIQSTSNNPIVIAPSHFMPIRLKDDPAYTTLYEKFASLWNSTNVLDENVGVHEYLMSDVYVINPYNQEIVIDRVGYHYEIGQDIFQGQLKAIKTEGIFDVRKQVFTTQSLLTEPFNPTDALTKWKQIDNYDIQSIGSHFVVEAVSEMYPTFTPIDEDES